jgi:hypothetical protein
MAPSEDVDPRVKPAGGDNRLVVGAVPNLAPLITVMPDLFRASTKAPSRLGGNLIYSENHNFRY